ncbi:MULTISPECIES: hypothetical protein [Cyanophyceae]|uniref:Uncharacterized protein n=1 Tax=Leptolyngbya subtilissima DQ-A4 TaxID=2933933 RepID=A0ABV0KDJ9_9CYAN|nr:hypothetical protein [Nodosilinea sp. FACHB-141]MBD2114882.1 hypothetical protein [Nodosilinea sp. FACHB-141]
MTEPPQDPLPANPQPTDSGAPGTEPASPVSDTTEPPQAPLPVNTQAADLGTPGAEPASPVSTDQTTTTANSAEKPMLAAIVSEASKNLSGKIFLGAWFATLAIAGITFSLSYLKASNWLNRGKEIGEKSQQSCVQRHFQGMIPSMSEAEGSIESVRRDAIAQRQEINTRRLELVTKRNTLQTEPQDQEAADISQFQKQLDKENIALKELDKILRDLGIPKISIGEVNQLWEQDQAIQKRIHVHYDITRTFYATHQAGSVGAALALLFGSIVLIFISGDIWEGKIKNNPGLVFPLILFGSTYVLFLNLPTVLSAEEIYQTNLTQYIGYINLEEEICTVLATERFVGDLDQPGTIQAIEFNRLVHSVEKRMRELNTRTISSDVRAIDSLRLDLDALSYPRKSVEKTK